MLFNDLLGAIRAVVIAGMAVGLLSTGVSVRAASLVKVDGSSTVFPITEAVAEEFQAATRGKVRVTVGISGTGGGFKKFCRDEIDVVDASRPILSKEMEACKQAGVQYYELPVAYDALTVMVNPKNNWAQSITVEELKKIWAPEAQGKITHWNQVRAGWPKVPLKLYGAGSDSGNFYYFTEAVVGKAKSSRGDYTASEDDNVLVQGISNDTNALGYFGFAYYSENIDRLKALAVDSGKGPVSPSVENVENGSYQPLARPIFIYINKDSALRPEVKQFIEFYMKHAAALVEEVKYIPLPAKAYQLALSNFSQGKLGTVFGGISEINIKIDDLLQREGKH